ncbi:MAG: hypothetical protein N2645_13970 [Clostridia bacterium]|nr:hypothetical protein [Clostridia bacterium]
MDINAIKEAIIKNVYHIDAGRKVSLQKHDKSYELFYCIAGSGFGVLKILKLFMKGKMIHVNTIIILGRTISNFNVVAMMN